MGVVLLALGMSTESIDDLRDIHLLSFFVFVLKSIFVLFCMRNQGEKQNKQKQRKKKRKERKKRKKSKKRHQPS